MGKIVVLAEKPSVGRDIARVIGCKTRGDGCLVGEQYIVTWAVGHLVTLAEPDEMDEKYRKWTFSTLPILPDEIPLKVIHGTRSQFSIVKKLINDKETDSLICATDAGREGELIFRYIYEKAGCKKPFRRLWISSMTDEAIKEGFREIRPGQDYDGLYESARCRSKADWLVGMNASRAFTLKYDTLLSVGRVQTPTLAILVKRRKEIENFRPEGFCTLTADFGDYKGVYFSEKLDPDTHLKTKEDAEAVAAAVKGKTGTVTQAETVRKKDWPPQLYDLTSLQRDANRLLGFTADKTLKTAQSLYEKWKAITYPRTDSRYLPMDMLPRARQTLLKLPAMYQPLVHGIPWKEDGKLPFSKRIFDNAKVSDHHALLPTPQTAPLDKLPADERALFDLVAKRAIAAFYPPYVYDQVKIITKSADEVFKTTGRVTKDPGWKAVVQGQEAQTASTRKKAAEPEQTVLPDVQEGDQRQIKKASSKKEQTKPPAPHTDASLLYSMENAGRELADEALREQMKGSGLGTPATRAAIIERLIHVGYVQRRGKTLNATDKGVQLIEIAPEEISSPEMTGKWELALDEIARNQRTPERFDEGIRRLSAWLVEYARTTKNEGSFPPEERRKGKGGKKASSVKLLEGAQCPLCGKPVQVSDKAYGCSAWRDGCAFTLWKDCLTRGGGPALNDRLVTMLLKDHSVRGSTGTVALEDGQIRFLPKEQGGQTVSCPIAYKKK